MTKTEGRPLTSLEFDAALQYPNTNEPVLRSHDIALRACSLQAFQARAHQTARAHGWWDDQLQTTVEDLREDRSVPLNPNAKLNPGLVEKEIPQKLMLIVTEVAEAMEDYRVGAMVTISSEKGKPEGFPTELADIVIRCFDLAGAMDLDLQAEIGRKMTYNETRPYRHGGKRA